MDPILRMHLATALAFFANTEAGTASTDPKIMIAYAVLLGRVLGNGGYKGIESAAMDLWKALGRGTKRSSINSAHKARSAMDHAMEAMDPSWDVDPDVAIKAAIPRLYLQGNEILGTPIFM